MYFSRSPISGYGRQAAQPAFPSREFVTSDDGHAEQSREQHDGRWPADRRRDAADDDAASRAHDVGDGVGKAVPLPPLLVSQVVHESGGDDAAEGQPRAEQQYPEDERRRGPPNEQEQVTARADGETARE